MVAGARKFPQLTDKQGTFRILGRTDYTATVDFIKINY
jgi:hypothetical protein